MSCVLSVLMVELSHREHFTVEDIWPWNSCEMGSLTSLIMTIRNS